MRYLDVTGVEWTPAKVLALGTSYCTSALHYTFEIIPDEASDRGGCHDQYLTESGANLWARRMAPVIGLRAEAIRTVLVQWYGKDSDYGGSHHQYVCE